MLFLNVTNVNSSYRDGRILELSNDSEIFTLESESDE